MHAPLLIAIAVAIGMGAHYMGQILDWRVMTDELMWSKLGLNMWDNPFRGAHIRGVDIPVNGMLSPLVTSPLWGLLSPPSAYNAVQILNVVAMASAGIPVALLARELVDWRPAWWIAGSLAALTPWMALAGQMMTEAIAYPVFAWTLYALFRAVADPRPLNDVLAIAAVGLAYYARTQFIVLALLLPLVILLHEIGWRAVQGSPRRRAPLDGAIAAVRNHWVIVAAGALGLAWLAIGPSARSLLGTYGVTVDSDILPPGLLHSAEFQFDVHAVGIGVLPAVFFLAWALRSIVRPDDRRHHAFAVLGLVVAVALTFVVTSFVIRFSQGPQERYLFFIAPIFYVGTVVALLRVRRPVLPFAIGGIIVLALVVRTEYVPRTAPTFASPTATFHKVLDGRANELGRVFGFSDLPANWTIVVLCAAVLVGCALLIRSGRGRLSLAIVGSLLLLYQTAESRYVLQRAVEQGGSAERKRDWVDDALPDEATVALVPSPLNIRSGVPYFDEPLARIEWWDVEFWNKTVDRVYQFGSFDIYSFNLPHRTLELDRRTGELRGWDGSDAMVLSQSFTSFGPEATGPAVTNRELVLYPVDDEHPRAAWATLSGVGGDGWTSATDPTVVRVYPGPQEAGHMRRITFVLSASGVEVKKRPYRITGGGADVRGTVTSGAEELATQRQPVAVCLPSSKPVDLRLTTGSPLELSPEREVGLRLLAIESEPLTRAC